MAVTTAVAYPFASPQPTSAASIESPTTTLLKFHRLSIKASLGTEQAGIEFFKAVFLDQGVSPGCSKQNYTRPLVVRKKKSGRLGSGNTSPQLRKRRSTVSTPRSPMSPRTMAFERLATQAASSPGIPSPPGSTASFNPHHSIAYAFLSHSLDSPIPGVIVHPATNDEVLRDHRTGSTSSELHLGLGRFQAYDEAIRPGPSPPASPQPSPTRRNFGVADKLPRHRAASSPRGSVSGSGGRRVHRLPELPMTPTRAPPKAAALLGEGSNRSLRPSTNKSPRKKPHHFRPLHSSKAHEINMFFGDVPRKSCQNKPRPTSRKGESTLVRSKTSDEGKSTATSKANVDENGNLWLDVEEEQEFGWLLSEVSQRRATLHQVSLQLEAEAGVIIVNGVASDEEETWGMQAFTSVLDMPNKILAKAKAVSEAQARSVAASVTGSFTPPKQVSNLQSFLDIDPYAGSHSLQLSPVPIMPFTRHELSSSPSSSDGVLSSSPARSPKAKHRPAPLTLRGKPSTFRLPVLAVVASPLEVEEPAARPRPAKPTISQPQPTTAPVAPTTPFVRPRTAPAPNPAPIMLPQPASVLQATSPTSNDKNQPQSFFEAPSPVGGFRVLAKKMKWSIGKVVNSKNASKA